MRLFLLPVSTRRSLIYCERLITPTTAGQKTPWSERIVNKANDTWVGWEKAKGGWQKTITGWGNTLFKRIPYEEYGLKSLPPGTTARLADIEAGKLRLRCLYPAAFVKSSDGKADKAAVSGILEKLATERKSLHWQRLLYCFIGMPISAPFMIVPIVPNLPFYYLCFRAYCHYRALYGSKTLEALLKQKAIDFEPSTQLDNMYTAGLQQPQKRILDHLPEITAQDTEETVKKLESQSQTGGKETIVLKKWSGSLLASELNLPELEVEIERAVDQVEKALEQTPQNGTAEARKES